MYRIGGGEGLRDSISNAVRGSISNAFRRLNWGIEGLGESMGDDASSGEDDRTNDGGTNIKVGLLAGTGVGEYARRRVGIGVGLSSWPDRLGLVFPEFPIRSKSTDLDTR